MTPKRDPALAAFVTRTLRGPARQVRALRRLDAAALTDDAVHDTRVAIRRLRSHLRTLRPLLDRDAGLQLCDRLGELDNVLAPIRDADVLAARLAATAAGIDDVDREQVQTLLDQLLAGQSRARAVLLVDLAGGAFNALLRDLRRIDGRALLASKRRLRPALQRQCARTLRDLVAAVERGGRRPSDAELHRIRVLLKRSRYLLEASVPVRGQRTRDLTTHLARLQQLLGDHQDSVMLSAALVALQPQSPAERETIEDVLAAESDARRRLRRQWRSEWRRALARMPKRARR